MATARRHPTSDDYILAVKEAADQTSKIDYKIILRNRRRRSHVKVRWHAWRALHQKNYSVLGIATASGFDHTTVLHGLRQLQRIETANAVG